MTKKTIFSRIMAIALCIMTLLSLTTVFSFASTSGGKKSATIYVESKANYWYPGASSVTLTQQKQTLTFKALFSNKTKTKTGYYGCYDIKVYNVTKGRTQNVYWGGGKTKKISLDPNCVYRITVRYNDLNTDLFTSAPLGYSWKKSTSPSWWVSSTWKLSSCY